MERWSLALIQAKPSLSLSAIRLGVAYSFSFDASGSEGCYKLDRTLADLAGLSVHTVRGAKRELQDRGFIFQVQKPDRGTVTFPALPEAAELDDDIPY